MGGTENSTDPAWLAAAVRVRRLVAGVARPEDIAAILLYLRRRSFGCKLVSEMGDFVAHSDERDKGHSFRFTKDQTLALAFHLQILGGKQGIHPWPAGLDVLQSGVMAAFRVSAPDYSIDKLGVPKERAKRLLERALSKVQVFEGGQVSVSPDLSNTEDAALRAFFGILSTVPAFSASDLMDELIICLAKNKLIQASDLSSLAGQVKTLGIYCLAKMHSARIKLPTGEPASLQLGVEYGTRSEDYLVIVADIPAPDLGVGTRVVLPFFDTDCGAHDWCSPTLRAVLTGPSTSTSAPIEINGDGKLAFLDLPGEGDEGLRGEIAREADSAPTQA